jgi:hypothetical protein
MQTVAQMAEVEFFNGDGTLLEEQEQAIMG